MQPEPGLPRWALWSLSPLILVVGFVTGMAIATYLPREVGQPADSSPQPTIAITPPGNSQERTIPSVDSSWRIPSQRPKAAPAENQPPPITDLPPGPSPPNGGLTIPLKPSAAYHIGPVESIRDARQALALEFGWYAVTNSRGIKFEYQQMRHTGSGRSLVGIISTPDYLIWEESVREFPQQLTAWLQRAAARVQQASSTDGFHLSWAVVDVVPKWPEGFADFEITRLQNESYLVVRPLAATVDHTNAEIALRPLTNLVQASAGNQVPLNSPWATYGPVLRFNETDLYRPLHSSGTITVETTPEQKE